MRRGKLLGLSVVAMGMCFLGAPSWASGPEVGLNFGAAMPLSKYRDTVDGDVGGTFGMEGGYRFNLTDNLAISLLGNPQFVFFGTEEDCCSGKNDEEMGTVFSITSGPRLSFLAEGLEIYIGGAGGYYRDMSGPMSDDGAGWNAGGGMNFEVAPGTSVGFFGRYDWSKMVATPGSGQERQYVLAGVAVQHVFEPEPALAEAPPPPPPPPPPPRPLPPPPPPPTERRGG